MTSCEHAQGLMLPLFEARDYVSGDAFSLERCPDCGLVFVLPAPSPQNMSRYYPESYYRHQSSRRFPAVVESLQRCLYSFRARRVGNHAPRTARRVLDIGCGPGFLLDAFRRQGWVVQGVELSDSAARHGREVLGLDIHVGSLSDEALTDRSFEAVVLWHVLEHTQDPRELLGEVHRLLSENGVLLVSVPDFGSLEARLSTSAWFHLDVPRHLVHFTQASLTELLNQAGFEIITRFRFAPEFDLFSFIQSSLNLMGLPANYLYRLLRGQGAKLPNPKDRWWHTPLTLALSIPIGLAGLFWVPIVGCLGRGSTLSYLVRKTHQARS